MNSEQIENFAVGKLVLVRTESAGVHFGALVGRTGGTVLLGGARRIWSWGGANTLSEISLTGLDKTSKVSEKVAEILLLGAIEILPVTDAAMRVIDSRGWGT